MKGAAGHEVLVGTVPCNHVLICTNSIRLEYSTKKLSNGPGQAMMVYSVLMFLGDYTLTMDCKRDGDRVTHNPLLRAFHFL